MTNAPDTPAPPAADPVDPLDAVVAQTSGGRFADLVRSMLDTVLAIDTERVERLELKIADRALWEMAESWRVFNPYRGVPKVTVFGSARTAPDAPDYLLAKDFGSKIADEGWMVMTGAGPGIMTAGIEGAGRAKSFGINIDLPFEAAANEAIRGDDKVIDFKYFFTRKLSFVKEAAAFVLLPGGFGTMDEGFELLTLMQTGKTFPAPVVLLDAPGSTYWASWVDFVKNELLDGGLISPDDLALFHHTHDVDDAVAHIQQFYRCYHSIRYVGKRLVIRLWRGPDEAQLAEINREFADIVVSGEIETIKATRSEIRTDDVVDLDRIAFRFNRKDFARLQELIWRLNEFGDTPEHGSLLHHDFVDPSDTELPED